MDNSSIAQLVSLIKKGVDNGIKELHTSLPGIIESFDPATQLATVQPAINRVLVTNDGERKILSPSSLPLLINVLVQFPRGGGYVSTFPVSKGDECWLIFSERSIDNWLNTGEISNPSFKRFHSLSDAIAILGIFSQPNKLPNFNPNAFEIMKEDGSAKITIESGKTTITGDLEVLGETRVKDITSNNINIGSTHTHPYTWTGTPGAGNTGTPT